MYFYGLNPRTILCDYEVPNCVFFSIVLLHLSVVQIFPKPSVPVTMSFCNSSRIRDKPVIDRTVYICGYENVLVCYVEFSNIVYFTYICHSV